MGDMNNGLINLSVYVMAASMLGLISSLILGLLTHKKVAFQIFTACLATVFVGYLVMVLGQARSLVFLN